MSVKDWKFHDFDMLLNHVVKIGRERKCFPVAYRMTHLPWGSACVLYPLDHDGTVANEGKPWMRKTRNEGSGGSTRYEWFPNLDAAMAGAMKWARRKDEETTEYLVVENAGYEGERDVHRTKSSTAAYAWVESHYERDELETLHVGVCRINGNHREYI